jgi:hypothetical protein
VTQRVSEKPSSCRSRQHRANHGEVDPHFPDGGQHFVIRAQVPVVSRPGNRAFHHPPPRQQLESGRQRGGSLSWGHQTCFGGVRTIATAQLNAVASQVARGPWETASAQRIARRGTSVPSNTSSQRGAVAVVQVGGMDHDDQQHSRRIEEDVAGAPTHRLGVIVPARPRLR